MQLPLANFSPSYRGKPGTWCRACFAANARGDRKSVEHEPIRCAWCGESFVPRAAKKNAVGYCSPKCKGHARARAAQDKINAAKPARVCVWCGESLPRTMRADAKFCSSDCNMRAHRTTRNFRRRMGVESTRPRKNPLINFGQIAERDKWRCGLCGGAVSKTRQHPDPLAASIDHIVPLSQGGTNEPANLQLAHLRCNLSKRDRPQGEQTRLI